MGIGAIKPQGLVNNAAARDSDEFLGEGIDSLAQAVFAEFPRIYSQEFPRIYSGQGFPRIYSSQEFPRIYSGQEFPRIYSSQEFPRIYSS